MDFHIGEKEYSQKGPNSAAIGENQENLLYHQHCIDKNRKYAFLMAYEH